MKLAWKANKPPRELADHERSIIEKLLSYEFQGRNELMRQLDQVKVSAEYETPGYPTIKLEIDNRKEPANVIGRVPVEAIGLDADGEHINFLLHVVNGFMAELEIFRDDLNPVQTLPKPEHLYIY